VVITAGQVHESTQMQPVLDQVRVPRPRRGRPRKRAEHLTCDKAFSCARCRKLLHQRGIRHVIPERKDQREHRQNKGQKGGRPCRYDKAVYATRNVVERCINKLKQFRSVATRYDKRADCYRTMVTLAAILLWMR
jgi:transposase